MSCFEFYTVLKCCCDLFHEHHTKNNARKKALQNLKMSQSWASYGDFPRGLSFSVWRSNFNIHFLSL